jgi:hypothetical protein
MSEPDGAVRLTPRRYSGGQIALVAVGIIFLLPGACSLVAALASIDTWNPRDPYNGIVLGIWTACFIVSALGVGLIVFAFKRARRPQ